MTNLASDHTTNKHFFISRTHIYWSVASPALLNDFTFLNCHKPETIHLQSQPSKKPNTHKWVMREIESGYFSSHHAYSGVWTLTFSQYCEARTSFTQMTGYFQLRDKRDFSIALCLSLNGIVIGRCIMKTLPCDRMMQAAVSILTISQSTGIIVGQLRIVSWALVHSIIVLVNKETGERLFIVHCCSGLILSHLDSSRWPFTLDNKSSHIW